MQQIVRVGGCRRLDGRGERRRFDLLERGFYAAPRGLIALSLAIEDTHVRALLNAMRDIVTERAGFL